MCTRISYFCDWINYNFLYLHDIIEYKLKKMNKFFNNDINDNKKSTNNDYIDSMVIDKNKTNNIKIKIIDTEEDNSKIFVNPVSNPASPSSTDWDII